MGRPTSALPGSRPGALCQRAPAWNASLPTPAIELSLNDPGLLVARVSIVRPPRLGSTRRARTETVEMPGELGLVHSSFIKA